MCAGLYAALIPISTYILLYVSSSPRRIHARLPRLCLGRKKGFKSRANVVMLSVTTFMFLLTTAYWTVSFASVVQNIRLSLLTSEPHDGSLSEPLWNAIVLVNVRIISAYVSTADHGDSQYIITDGVVVWRAWILCQDSIVCKRMLFVSLFFLAWTACA